MIYVVDHRRIEPVFSIPSEIHRSDDGVVKRKPDKDVDKWNEIFDEEMDKYGRPKSRNL